MEYPVYAFLVDLLQPVVLLCLLAATVLIGLWRKSRETRGRVVGAAAALLLLAGLCTRAAAYLALGSLEWRYPPEQARPDAVGAIVVLSANMVPADQLLPAGELGDGTVLRCLHAARLYRQGPSCLVVASGGPEVARLMRDFLIEQGVARPDLLMEEHSSSTYENALESGKLLRERGIVKIALVTEATHLLRAARCFSSQGFEVAPCGCHYRATHFSWSLCDFVPTPGQAAEVQRALHEWLGMAWYRLRGRI